MTRDDFYKRFQGRMLLFLADAWAARKGSPADLGLLMDDHARQLKGLLREMYDAATEVEAAEPKPAPSGATTQQVKK